VGTLGRWVNCPKSRTVGGLIGKGQDHQGGEIGGLGRSAVRVAELGGDGSFPVGSLGMVGHLDKMVGTIASAAIATSKKSPVVGGKM